MYHKNIVIGGPKNTINIQIRVRIVPRVIGIGKDAVGIPVTRKIPHVVSRMNVVLRAIIIKPFHLLAE